MTRLEILCKIHKVQGGTIFQYNQMYDKDFIAMTDEQFKMFIERIMHAHVCDCID